MRAGQLRAKENTAPCKKGETLRDFLLLRGLQLMQLCDRGGRGVGWDGWSHLGLGRAAKPMLQGMTCSPQSCWEGSLCPALRVQFCRETDPYGHHSPSSIPPTAYSPRARHAAPRWPDLQRAKRPLFPIEIGEGD